MKVAPAAAGKQVVRTALPLSRGFFREGQTLIADDGRRKIETAVRSLFWHPTNSAQPKSARRVMVTFPYALPERRAS